MIDFFAQVVADFKELGMWFMIHGSKVWLGLVIWCVLSIVLVIGMWLGALLGANREDNDK